MENMTIETRKDGKLAIVVDPKLELRASTSGKSVIVATSGGNRTVFIDEDGNEVKLGFNMYKVNNGAKLAGVTPKGKGKAKKAKPSHAVETVPAAGDIAALIRAEIAKALGTN